MNRIFNRNYTNSLPHWSADLAPKFDFMPRERMIALSGVLIREWIRQKQYEQEKEELLRQQNKGKQMRLLIALFVTLLGFTPVNAEQHGKASYYWQPQKVACGGYFNPNALTAAHKTLPCGTKVRVTNKNNGKSVVVTINDRGPFIKGRIIDLSKAAAQRINMTGAGVVPVKVSRL